MNGFPNLGTPTGILNFGLGGIKEVQGGGSFLRHCYKGPTAQPTKFANTIKATPAKKTFLISPMSCSSDHTLS